MRIYACEFDYFGKKKKSVSQVVPIPLQEDDFYRSSSCQQW